ncbi:hypothetical protein [Halopiger aswanensis]|uniref:E2/UBC family protein E n=1 Tax=Halopiger aswanensis TaxID=148449 RepID=A0A3R7KIA4_9EURY|nr:hypothetical protein [Halopiger aswanensis]RKD86230.1 hypothetical protein ATJ93_4647 [Halopiger aswanensis]
MNVERAVSELTELRETLAQRQQVQVSYDLATRGVIRIDGLEFPPGWETPDGSRRGAVLLDLPEEYPRYRPRVYISESMRLRGDRPPVMVPERIDGDGRWAQVDVFSADAEWNPETDDLLTIFERLQRRLRSQAATGRDSDDAVEDC